MAWHALVGWWLLHALPRLSSRGNGDDALQVVYVTLPPLSTPSPRTRAGTATRRGRHAERPRKPRRSTTTTAATTAAAPTLRVVAEPPPDLFAQARALARQQAAATAPAADVFADRPARLPQADAGRFRMRTPLTVARVVEAVSAELFYPPGYEADPCPRNRSNIAGLLAAGDSPRLQLELQFEREHCRP